MRSAFGLATQCSPSIRGSQRPFPRRQQLTPAIWAVGGFRDPSNALQQLAETSSQCMARKSARPDEQQQKQPQAQTRALSSIPISEKKHLVVRKLLGSDIFEVDGVLTAAECKCFVAAADTAGFQHQTSRGPRFGEALRENGRLQLQDEALAQRLWLGSGLSQVFQGLEVDGQLATGLNANLRLYRYTPGQHFGRHLDDSVEASPGRWTMYTLLIYLSDGLTGGETVFYGGRGKKVASVTPTVGKALLHLHGDDCLEHESVAISRGTKYILRSDVVFG